MVSAHLHSSRTSYDGQELVRYTSVVFIGKEAEHKAVFDALHEYGHNIEAYQYSHPLATGVNYGLLYSFFSDPDVETSTIIKKMEAVASAIKR